MGMPEVMDLDARQARPLGALIEVHARRIVGLHVFEQACLAVWMRYFLDERLQSGRELRRDGDIADAMGCLWRCDNVTATIAVVCLGYGYDVIL